ncbi:hypothetical protein BB559_007220, partial [Furculomyces boomerangus]
GTKPYSETYQKLIRGHVWNRAKKCNTHIFTVLSTKANLRSTKKSEVFYKYLITCAKDMGLCYSNIDESWRATELINLPINFSKVIPGLTFSKYETEILCKNKVFSWLDLIKKGNVTRIFDIPESFRNILSSIGNSQVRHKWFIETKIILGGKDLAEYTSKTERNYLKGEELVLTSYIQKWSLNKEDNSNITNWEGTYLLRASPKIKSIIWLFLHNGIHTGVRLSKFMKDVSKMCTYCNEEESFIHMFYECPRVANFWKEIAKLFSMITICSENESTNFTIQGDDILNQLVSFENMVPNTKSLHAFAIWTIYKSRVEMNLQNILADGIVMFTRWLVEVKEQIARDVKKGKAAAKSWQTPKSNWFSYNRDNVLEFKNV